jgi:hypothetical protein
MECAMGSVFELKFGDEIKNIPKDLLSINEDTKLNIIKDFNNLKFIEKNNNLNVAIIPLTVSIFGSNDKEYLEVEVFIKNTTSQNWFMPSIFDYYGNRFLKMEDELGTYYFPDIQYRNKVVTNDSTMWLLEQNDILKVSYKIKYSERMKKYKTKISIDHNFIPSFIAKQIYQLNNDKIFRAKLKSNNYIQINYMGNIESMNGTIVNSD